MKPITELASLVSALAISVAASAAPASGKVSAELFPNTDGTLAEVKTSVNTGPAEDFLNVQYFARIRRADYGTRDFMNNELSLGAYHGVRVVVQAKGAMDQFRPYAGLSFVHETPVHGAQLRVFASPTVSVEDNPIGELLVPTSLQVPTTENQAVRLEVEPVVWLNRPTPTGARAPWAGSLRIHIGYNVSAFTVGVAAEVDYTPGNPVAQRAGGFIRLNN